MRKITDAVVRVHIAKELWESSLLKPFFEDPTPGANVPMYFTADNCEFDEIAQ
jgi:hypothetical protein